MSLQIHDHGGWRQQDRRMMGLVAIRTLQFHLLLHGQPAQVTEEADGFSLHVAGHETMRLTYAEMVACEAEVDAELGVTTPPLMEPPW